MKQGPSVCRRNSLRDPQTRYAPLASTQRYISSSFPLRSPSVASRLCSSRFVQRSWFVVALILSIGLCASTASAQFSSNVSGTVTDSTGAVVSDAAITIRDTTTSAIRTVSTDLTGRYQISSLPVGVYELHVTKPGFSEETRAGIHLAVGQDAVVNVTLEIGELNQRLTVQSDAPLVSVATSDVSGLVGEQEIKYLPLNGRSFDLLMPLNPGIINFTSEKTGGVGVSNSTVGNNFSVSGNRPQQNLFLLNGVEFTGAAENNMQPGGTSQQLLGVNAVREFNVLRDNYGAEYGKRPGAQVLIVTQSGTNEIHGSLYEFIRNNALDARNYFDRNASAPPFERNQFGASLGGPIQKDKTFLFGNYEGFRQQLHQTGVDLVPDANARNGFLPCALVTPTPSPCPPSGLVDVGVAPGVAQMFSLWPMPSPNAPDLGGISEAFNSPLQTIRDDFGTIRLDRNFSSNDTLSAVYTIDDSADVTPTSTNLYSTDLENLREQVFSLAETHIFSPSFLNTIRFGYSRAAYYFTGEPSPGTPAASVSSFVGAEPVGAVVVGGSAAANPAAQLSLAGSNIGSNLPIARNLFTFEDSAGFTRGRHQFTFGVWFQRLRSNEDLALTQFGQATFTGLQQMLEGNIGTFLYDPAPTRMNWRSWLGAWYAQDVIRINPKLTVSLGFRDEFTNGWNEAHGRAASFIFVNNVIQTNPRIANSAFTVNNAKFLPAPRIGVAWAPFSNTTVIRAGFGMYYDLQDALGYRMDQNAPFNPSYSVSGLSVSDLPLPVSPVPASAKIAPAGVQPNLQTPTLISYSVKLEHELSPNTAVSLGYVGSHGNHEIVSLDDNQPTPVICPASPCPAAYPANFPAPLAGSSVPAGSYYIPSGTPLANSSLGPAWAWFSVGDSSYNALQFNITHRFSGGLSFRGVYTWSKSLDNGDSLNQTAAQNAPGLVSNPFNLRADWGPATFDVRNVGVVNATYELPIGRGKPFLNSLGGIPNAFASGWTVNSIVTLQSGFPFTPELSYNPSNNGDTKNPVRPFLNPNFAGPVILGTPGQWFNPAAFLAPPPNSGFYGDVGRDSLIGPGLATWDFSVLKQIPLHDRFSLQFRAEFFNILNHANFNTPNLIVFTPSGVSPTAGRITSTSTTARQVQFALQLLW